MMGGVGLWRRLRRSWLIYMLLDVVDKSTCGVGEGEDVLVCLVLPWERCVRPSSVVTRTYGLRMWRWDTRRYLPLLRG